MIDTDKYEGHTPANLWGREIVAEGKGKIFLNTAWLSSIGNDVYSNEIDRKLMIDAPLLLAEVKRLTEFRDRVLVAFVEMPRNGRSLTYLLDELGYLKHYSREDYLKGLHPHSLGLYELKDEWVEKAKQYLEDDEE